MTAVLARLPLAASGWIALLCTQLVAGGAPLRIAVVGGYLLVCPGLALLRPFGEALRSRPEQGLDRNADEQGTESAQTALLVVMLSLSALVVASTGLMLLGGFTGTRTLLAVAGLTTVAALLPKLRSRLD
jgi:hypothetical protein